MFGLSLSLACQGQNGLTEPAKPVQAIDHPSEAGNEPPLNPNDESARADRPTDLALAEENSFKCTSVTLGSHGLRRSGLTIPHSFANSAAAGASLEYFRYVRWDRQSKNKVMELLCVIPLTLDAAHSSKAFAMQLDYTELYGLDSSGLPVLVLGEMSNRRNAWGDDWIHCYAYSGGDVECEGTTCSLAQTLRLDDFDVLASHLTWYCSNGCNMSDFDAYWCPSGSGYVDTGNEGGGGAGGGGGGNGEPDPSPFNGDEVSDLAAKPNCQDTNLSREARLWCIGRFPYPNELTVLNQAIERMRGRGAACFDLAEAATHLIADSAFRVGIRQVGTDPAGSAAKAGDWAWVASEYFSTYLVNGDGWGRNLDNLLAHEMDHLLNHVIPGVTDERGHRLDVYQGVHTLNSQLCGGDTNS